MTTEKNKPEHFKRRILLAVAGGSPAILTETLYALAKETNPPYLPTEIHIITTTKGRQSLQPLLGENSKISALAQDYGLELPNIPEGNIHVITDVSGKPLFDITTAADNESAADKITDKVRELTKDDTASIYVSIAGGRKTMSYYLGYAMSVFGRVQDRMSHVLVDDKYMSEDFYYPTPQPQMCKPFRGEPFDASQVTVKLGELPFIRLRDGLTDDLLNKAEISYSNIITIAQRQLAPISVRVVLGKEPKLFCGGEEIKLPPAQLALYVWMLQRHKTGKLAVTFTDKATKIALAEEFKAVYAEISDESEHYVNATQTIKSIDTDYFGAPRTNINKKLSVTLGKPKAKAYLLMSGGSKNAMHYRLSDELKPTHITFE